MITHDDAYVRERSREEILGAQRHTLTRCQNEPPGLIARKKPRVLQAAINTRDNRSRTIYRGEMGRRIGVEDSGGASVIDETVKTRSRINRK